jgi:formylglycine-generating enzyme required for sulfatase activity
MTPVENIKIDAQTLRETSTYCAPATFLMGTSLGNLHPEILSINKEKHLSLGSILAATPPRWVFTDGFSVGRKMVTNGEYSLFLKYADPDPESESGYSRFYDNPDLWRYVWGGLNFRINSLKMPVGEQTGGISTREENYDHVDNFVEAYLLSIRYEIERLLFSSEGGGSGNLETMYMRKADGKTEKVEVPKHDVVERVFRCVQKRVWESMQEEESFYMGGYGEEEGEDSPQEIAQFIDSLTRNLIEIYMENVDRRFRQMLRKGAYPVETILFLQRFKHQILKLPPDKPVPLHKVLYPRFWKAPTGVMKKRTFQGDEVPWEELPVTGLSLYEALAYTTWLTQLTGLKVTLPNEAQFERAASWPDGPAPEGDPVELDPRKKFIFPWESQESREFHDFNYYFGQAGQDMENYFYKHQGEYRELLENTAKVDPDGGKIYMLLGWGWQWTVDRYAEEELKYSRFDPRNYPLLKDRTYRDTQAYKNVTVFKYRPNADIESSYFVVRGAPDVIGGPGTTTRRFALNPLRGYRNVGFRFAFNQK